MNASSLISLKVGYACRSPVTLELRGKSAVMVVSVIKSKWSSSAL